MKKYVFFVSATLLLLQSNSAFSQATSLCAQLGQRVFAVYSNQIYDDVGHVIGNYPCPPAGINIGGDTCYTPVNVSQCNEHGFGSCGGSQLNKLTQECLNLDACNAAFGSLQPYTCIKEKALADAAVPVAEDCNSMSGTWDDNSGAVWNIADLDSITGIEQPGGSYGLCGTWDVSGIRLKSTGDIQLQADTRQNPPYYGPSPDGLFTVACASRLTLAGTAACGIAFGTWRNDQGRTGDFDMVKKFTPYHANWSPPLGAMPLEGIDGIIYPVQTTPLTPILLSAVIGDHTAHIYWSNAQSDTTRIYKATSVDGPWTLLRYGITEKDYTATSLSNFVTYYFKVRGDNANGESTDSTIVEATPGLQPLPIYISTANRTSGQIYLYWLLSSYATGYRVFMGPSGVGPWSLMQDIPSGVTASTTITGLDNTDVHYFVVEAYNPKGVFDTSSVLRNPQPGPFSLNTGLTTQGSSWVKVNWNPSQYAANYYVYKTTDLTGQTGWTYTGQSTSSTGSSATVGGLTNGVSVAIKVMSSNSVGTAAAPFSVFTPHP